METDKALLRDESLRTGITGMMRLAQRAYDEKRRKDCIALTAAILKIESENSGARRLLALIQSDIDKALRQVDLLIQDPHWNLDPALHKNAVRLLQSVLDIDPQHGSAGALLLQISPESVANRNPPRRETSRGLKIEKVSYPIDLTDRGNTGGASTPWMRRAYILVAILLAGGVAFILFR